MKSNGFTLIETLVTVTILALITAIGLPSFSTLLVDIRVDNEINHLNRLLLVSRNIALNTSQAVTLCPLKGNTCENQWQLPLSVFTDANNNKIFEPHLDEKIIQYKKEVTHGDKLQYGTTRKGLTYASDGYLIGWGQNATFIYCPLDHPNKSRAVTVAVSGRTYKSEYNANKGKDQTRSGKAISCK